MRLATGPVTWGVDFADSPNNPPWELVLDEIAASPLDALELGPVGYLPERPEQLREALCSRSLRAVGSFVFDNLHDPVEMERVLAVTERVCRWTSAAQGEVVVIIDQPSPVRAVCAGRSAAAPRLSVDGWRRMLVTVERIAAIARGFGLRPAVHPHAGGYIEFEDEIGRLVADTDLDLCLDTGHLAYADVDPVGTLKEYGSRLAHVHLKDVDRNVLGRVRARGLDFWAAIEEGVFCPLGRGAVDFAAVARGLHEVGYAGFSTIEQDRVPGSGSPLEDLVASVEVIEAVSRDEVRD